MKNLLLILWSCGLSLAAFAQSVSEPIDLEIPAGTIHGTLLLPQAATSVPVVLMIAGSGPTDRDGNTVGLLGKNDSLLLLAQALAEHGIASLRYDKRGIAASREAGPSEADLRFENYAEDASAWLDLLAQDSRFSTRYLLGHSEGSLLGMLALRTHPEVAFISIAGPADDAASLLRRQLASALPPALTAANESILSQLEAGQLVSEVPPQFMALYRQSVQPYLISWFKYDPKTEIANIHAPCLILQGTTDIQVEAADAERLHAANNTCELRMIEDMNHVFKYISSTGAQEQQRAYLDPALPLAPGLVDALADFLTP